MTAITPNPPEPPVWAPTLRRASAAFCRRMDTRKARQEALAQADVADRYWVAQYAAWWNSVGWQEGAENPDAAMARLRAYRKATIR